MVPFPKSKEIGIKVRPIFPEKTLYSIIKSLVANFFEQNYEDDHIVMGMSK